MFNHLVFNFKLIFFFFFLSQIKYSFQNTEYTVYKMKTWTHWIILHAAITPYPRLKIHVVRQNMQRGNAD